MRIIRIFLEKDLSQEALPLMTDLEASDAHHLRNVLRLRDQDPLHVFDRLGNAYEGIFWMPMEEEKPRVKIIQKLNLSQEKSLSSLLQVSVFQVPPRAGRMDDLIRPLSELGTTCLRPLLSERGVLNLDESRWKKRLERWERIAKESAKQCGRKLPMLLDSPIDFQKALDEISNLDLGFILVPNPEKKIPPEKLRMKLKGSEKIPLRLGLLVGPEGGFSEAEILLAQKKGWQGFCFHSNTLRCETAAPAAMAIFQFMVS